MNVRLLGVVVFLLGGMAIDGIAATKSARIKSRRHQTARWAKKRHRPVKSAFWLKQYRCQDYRLMVSYDPGHGATCREVRQRSGASFVFGGGYYFWRTPRDARAVDLVVTPMSRNGQRTPTQRVAYRQDKQRPVVQAGDDWVAIIHPNNGERLDRSAIYAIAADFQPRDPERSTWRQVLALKNKVLLCFTFRNANYRYCERMLKQYGVQAGERVYLDGGRSVCRPGYDPRKPIHIMVVPRKHR